MASKIEKPMLAFVSSFQNGKTPDLPNIDLRTEPVFEGIINQFNTPFLGTDGQCLDFERQMASPAMSAASHFTFVHHLRQNLSPKYNGRLTFEDPFTMFLTGHSVGEMASFVEAGMIDAATLAWVLYERERITSAPISSGIRMMLAAVNLDMPRFKLPVQEIKNEFDGRVQAVLANKNTAMEGVLSVHIMGDEDVKSIIRRLNNLLADFKHPLAERPVRLMPLPISNAFHSRFLKLEENLLINTVKPKLTPDVFTDPDPNIYLYSAMANRRIKNRKQGLDVLFHQLTAGVDFPRAMEEMLRMKNLVAVVTADVSEKTPKMVIQNIGDRVPVLNIKDLSSLGEAVDQTSSLILPYSR